MRQLRVLAAIVAGWAVNAGPANAQNPFPYAPPVAQFPFQGQAGQFQRPPVLSPYLNLYRGGPPAVNYFNFVVPQLQLNQPGSGTFLGPPTPGYQPGDEPVLDAQDPATRGPRSSAHPTTFNYTGSYFNSLGTIGVGGRPMTPPPAPMGRRR